MQQVPKTSRSLVKPINLALQGGGSHGAFTWGVLDRLLEDERLDIEGDQRHQRRRDERGGAGGRHRRGGREGARAALQQFWKAVSDAARFSPIQRTCWTGCPAATASTFAGLPLLRGA